MRGFAAILVVCHHIGFFKYKSIGALGVHMFFVLSAFLLTMILDKKVQKLIDSEATTCRLWLCMLLDYLVRRVLRVYPLYAIMVLVVSLSSYEHKKQWYKYEGSEDAFSGLKMLVFADGHRFGVFWTLPLELTYYLLVPVIAVVAVTLRQWWWVPVPPLLCWIVYTGLYEPRLSWLGFSAHLPTFVCGSVAAIIHNRTSSWIRAKMFKFRWYHTVLLRTLEVAALVMLVSVCFDALIFDWFGPYPFRGKYGDRDSDHCVCVYVSVVILVEMLHPGELSAVMEWVLLRYAGKISFSMYLLHSRIVYSSWIRAQTSFYTLQFSLWFLVFFWSIVSYHAIEAPSQKLSTIISSHIKTWENQASSATQ